MDKISSPQCAMKYYMLWRNKDSQVEDPWMNLSYMLKIWAKISGLSEDGETKSSEVEK